MNASFYAFLANSLVVIHLAYIGYVIFGQLAILIGWPLRWRWVRNPWFRVSHLIMILIVAFEALVGFKCPLTTWEENLRNLAGQVHAEDDLGFIDGLLRQFVQLDPKWDPVVNSSYYVFAGIVLATIFLVPPRFRKHSATPALSEEPRVAT